MSFKTDVRFWYVCQKCGRPTNEMSDYMACPDQGCRGSLVDNE